MKSVKLLQKIVNIIPISILRYLAYSKVGSSVVKSLKEKGIGGEIIVELGDSVKIYSDLFSPRELQGGEKYEDKVKKIFLANIKEGDVIFDCGAKIGEFSLIAANKVGPDGKVFAIEPFRQTIKQLRKNFVLNKFKNYKILELAVSNTQGKETFFENPISGEGCLDSTLLKGKELNKTIVKLDTVDNIISEQTLDKVDMMKVDVEGFEKEVFEGCTDSFKLNKIKKIICEIHHDFLMKRGINEQYIYDLLKNSGYAIEFIDDSHIIAIKSS